MNDRFKFRVWDKKHNEYIPSNMISTLLYFGYKDGFHIEFECFSTFADSLIIEQCTGLKDKNGNLIYENDIVLGNSGFKYCIIWSEMELGWVLQNLKTRLCIAINAFMLDEIEIVGNIHEQAEQKDE